jgi:hypothetical protein
VNVSVSVFAAEVAVSVKVYVCEVDGPLPPPDELFPPVEPPPPPQELSGIIAIHAKAINTPRSLRRPAEIPTRTPAKTKGNAKGYGCRSEAVDLGGVTGTDNDAEPNAARVTLEGLTEQVVVFRAGVHVMVTAVEAFVKFATVTEAPAGPVCVSERNEATPPGNSRARGPSIFTEKV